MLPSIKTTLCLLFIHFFVLNTNAHASLDETNFILTNKQEIAAESLRHKNLKGTQDPLSKSYELITGILTGLDLYQNLPHLQVCQDNTTQIVSLTSEIINTIKKYSDNPLKNLEVIAYDIVNIFSNINFLITKCDYHLTREFEDLVCKLSKYVKQPDYFKKIALNAIKNSPKLYEFIVRSEIYVEIDLYNKLGLNIGYFIKEVVVPELSLIDCGK